MSIAFDAGSSSGNSSLATATATHVMGGVSNGILFGLAFTDGGDILTTMTYNLSTMTFIKKFNVNASNWIYIYYLVAPTSGSNSLVATFSGVSDCAVDGLSFSGASQTGQPDGNHTSSGTGSGQTITESVTTTADKCMAVLIARNGGGPYAAQTNSTANPNETQTFTATFYSTTAKTPAGSMSMAWSWSSGNTSWGDIMVTFSPAVATPANGNFLTFM